MEMRMEMDQVVPEKKKRHVCFSTMTWPLPDPDIQWRLRYAQASITTGDMFYLASVLGAYEQMINDSREKRETVCRELRAALANDQE